MQGQHLNILTTSKVQKIRNVERHQKLCEDMIREGILSDCKIDDKENDDQ